ncbi:hypothetical protein P280DRAFT_516375 [Massarina eburnea CBS 473.64]|uniref:Transposase IS30-like HTH domain-containing protein n=1 Tax=Massarina eburnea CBS 473.64 TaxID=1395130 RepID=A0A6A6S5Z1_9PLEO|nr:hypothetical protein P280DRAFT_516375 [Massarina eburnea CBS 473.64]
MPKDNCNSKMAEKIPPRTTPQTHLTREERINVFRWRAEGLTQREIAQRLGGTRTQTTVSSVLRSRRVSPTKARSCPEDRKSEEMEPGVGKMAVRETRRRGGCTKRAKAAEKKVLYNVVLSRPELPLQLPLPLRSTSTPPPPPPPKSDKHVRTHVRTNEKLHLHYILHR